MTSVPEILSVLDTIIDPCSIAAAAPAGISTLGIVRDIEIEGDSHSGFSILVRMGLTSPGCLMGAMFTAEAERRLLALPTVKSVRVDFVADFVWQPHHMDPVYREHLSRRRQAMAG